MKRFYAAVTTCFLLLLGMAAGASTVTYYFQVVDDNNNGVAGATLTQAKLKNLSTGANIGSVTLTPVDLGDGDYSITYDAETNGEAVVAFTASKSGVSLSGRNATISIVLAKDSGRILTNLDAAISTRATPAQILSNTSNLLATDSSGRVTVGAYASGQDPATLVWAAATRTITGIVGTTLPATIPSTSQIAAAILTTPANLLATDASGRVTIGSNNDKSGYSLTQTFPANFAALGITSGGSVTVGTNNDKSGYVLSQAFPANFSSLAISGGGTVTAGTVADKTGYSLSQAFPANFSSLAISGGGAVTAGSISGNVTVGGYASGQDPASLLFVNPLNKLLTSSSGYVNINLSQPLDTSNTGDTVGGGVLAARAQGFGKWVISGNNLSLYAADNVTVIKSFTITPNPVPATRQ